MTPSSAQYSCPAVIHSLLCPFLFSPPFTITSSHAQHSGFPLLCGRKAVSCQFPFSISHSCSLTKQPHLVEHTHFHTLHITEWLTDTVRLEPLLRTDSSALTKRMIRSLIIHSPPTSLPTLFCPFPPIHTTSLSLLLIIFILLYSMCVFVCGQAAEGGVVRFFCCNTELY